MAQNDYEASNYQGAIVMPGMQPSANFRGHWFQWIWVLGVAAIILTGPTAIASAGDGCHCYPWCYCRTPMLCHPDDYCCKPLPCVPCPPCKWYCDDYCRKPLPCVPCPPCKWYCDDYCPKPMPCVTWPSLAKKCCVPDPHPGNGR